MPAKSSPSFKFRSIQQASVVDQIIETFKHALINGELKPGQRLPSEAELVQQFGVGRSAIREAMKILQALGVVRIQQGNGTYIVDEPTPSILDPLIFALLLETAMSDDLVELRRLFEIGYCELAAQHATEGDWEAIKQAAVALEEYTAQPNPEVEILARLDLAFHHTILKASHNPLVLRLGQAIEELFFASMRNTYLAVNDNLDYATKFHREIMHALHDGNPEKIRAAVEGSLVYWREEVRKLRENHVEL
ncbi:MAG: FadR family transcriptional regulator [Chloroflexi bacterium]|nr:FadR family transcriptional regulator [Chloroflexota bacterium]